MNWRTELDARVDAIGDEPTELQKQKLQSWIIDNVPIGAWDFAAELTGVSDLYTDFRMRQAEMGMY